MTTTSPQARYEFEIDASVVYQLGEALISDEVQALVELVKNAYDADASYANIIVATDGTVGTISSMFPEATGYILIEDDGTGMGWEEIKNGWLTISSSPKREMKRKGQTTSKGRTPLGDKGLGRLGTQRLGRYLELWSTKKNAQSEFYVGIDWGEFKDKLLPSVPAYIGERQYSRKGTRLLIAGLRTSEVWTGTSQGELIKQLSQLISPFEDLRQFEVFIEINGKRLDLDKVARSVLDVADLRVWFSFDSRYLQINGKYRPTFLLASGQGSDTVRRYQDLIAPDKGADFFSYLLSKEQFITSTCTWEEESGWFISFDQQIELADIQGIKSVTDTTLGGYNPDQSERGSIANPGPFNGELYVLPRRDPDLEVVEIFSKVSEYRKYLDRLAGVRVFRDGFGIRPFGLEGNDWLKLGKAWTSGSSYYGLRPNNTVGYVALTATQNNRLEETTDREYFVENSYSHNFYMLMDKVVTVINDVNEKLRRGYNDYGKLRAEKDLGIDSHKTSTLFTQMRNAGAKSEELASQVAVIQDRITETSNRVTQMTKDIISSPIFHTEEELKVTPVLLETATTLSEAKSILEQVETILSNTKKLGRISDIIEPDIEYLREQLTMFSELAGLGLTAEALSHEMKTITDGLAARTTSLVSKLRTNQSVDPQVLAYTEFVHTTVSGFRKQLSHLDPSLRYVREKREVIRMAAFWAEMHDFYYERLSHKGIEFFIEETKKEFSVLLNRGQLTQVSDNMLLNSEYWLQEDLHRSSIQKASIHVQIREPFVEIYDTGRGVSPSIEHQLFQPFTTTKPKGIGRGLGLFISRQLLESSNCQILLLPDRNQFNRRYIFRIDFTGAIYNE